MRVVVVSSGAKEIRKRGASTVIHLNFGTDSEPRVTHLCSPKIVSV